MRYFLSTLFCLHVIACMAQDFRDGFIITLDKDSVYGLIRYRDNFKSGTICSFKTSESSSVTDYKPGEILGYRFTNGKYFVGKEIRLGGETQLFFLEFLVNGIVDIYFYTDAVGSYYFIDDGKGELRELTTEKRTTSRDGKMYEYTVKSYVGVLKNTFSESPSISKKAENASLSHKSLIRIAKDYHNEVCTTGEECLVYEKKIPVRSFQIGLTAGYSNSIFKVPSSNDLNGFFYLDNNGFNRASSPSVGAFIEKFFPLRNEKISILLDFQYKTKESYEGSASENTSESFQLRNDYSIELSRLSTTLVFKYSFFKGIVTPHAGLFYNSIISHEAHSRLTSIYLPTNEETFIMETDQIDIGLLGNQVGFSTGVTFGKSIALTISYQAGAKKPGVSVNQFTANLVIPVWKF